MGWMEVGMVQWWRRMFERVQNTEYRVFCIEKIPVMLLWGRAKTRFVWGIALARPVSIDPFPPWFKGF